MIDGAEWTLGIVPFFWLLRAYDSMTSIMIDKQVAKVVELDRGHNGMGSQLR
jgi:hypothetical protein